MDSIFVALSTFAEFGDSPVKLLKNSGVPFQVHTTGKRITKDELLRDAVGASVIIAGVEAYSDEIFAGLPALRCISRCGVGVDAIDLEAARAHNIAVLNTPDIPTVAVAELALSFYLSLSRNLRAQANSMGQHKWDRLEAHLISGKTLGIIGFGRIGRKVAEFCRPFGMNILACDPFVSAEAIAHTGVQLVDKEYLLARADIVSIHAAKAKSREPIVGADDYYKMKRGAMIVNLSRGGMIDEQGLLEAIRSGHLFGAGLDVFSEEPYNGPLCDLPNVILTPHSATQTIETRVAMEEECIDKALRFINGSIGAHERVV